MQAAREADPTAQHLLLEMQLVLTDSEYIQETS